jgi:hypothetical protein
MIMAEPKKVVPAEESVKSMSIVKKTAQKPDEKTIERKAFEEMQKELAEQKAEREKLTKQLEEKASKTVEDAFVKANRIISLQERRGKLNEAKESVSKFIHSSDDSNDVLKLERDGVSLFGTGNSEILTEVKELILLRINQKIETTNKEILKIA